MDGHSILSGGDLPKELIPLMKPRDFATVRRRSSPKVCRTWNKNRVLWLLQVPQEVANLLASQYAYRTDGGLSMTTLGLRGRSP